MDLSHENHSRWGTSALPAKPTTGGLSFEVSCHVLCERQDDVDILHGLCQVGGGNAPLDSATSLANHTALAGNLPILVRCLSQLRGTVFGVCFQQDFLHAWHRKAAFLCDQGRAIHEDEAFERVNQRGYVAMACGRTIFQWQQLRFNWQGLLGLVWLQRYFKIPACHQRSFAEQHISLPAHSFCLAYVCLYDMISKFVLDMALYRHLFSGSFEKNVVSHP